MNCDGDIPVYFRKEV